MPLRGRKPNLTLSEQVRLRMLQSAFGCCSAEVEEFWARARDAAHTRRMLKRGGRHPRRPAERKYEDWAAAHRAACRAYYERNKERIKEYQRNRYNERKSKGIPATPRGKTGIRDTAEGRVRGTGD